MDGDLDVSYHYELAAWRASCVLGCFGGGVASRVREVIITLCSALVRLHLECCAQIWGPQHKKDVELSEWAQRRATGMIQGLEHLSSK